MTAANDPPMRHQKQCDTCLIALAIPVGWIELLREAKERARGDRGGPPAGAPASLAARRRRQELQPLVLLVE